MNKELLINPELTARLLKDFIADEVRKVGFSKVVIGLSGGIDSATTAYLAVSSLGPEGVSGIMMPYRTSNPQSEKDALLVTERLGIEHLRVDITPMVEPLFQTFPQMDRLRRGNVMARERMVILYDQSREKSALVLGTSNKTEYLLGYTTLWGDMACALAPLGDLYKTQVYQLAAFLGVPPRILQKKPSADLWAGQTDEEELGFTYEKVDTLLYYMVDKRFTFSELEELGYKREFVKDVFKRIQTSQYKRRLPLIAKLSERTIDRDFRYPRDWGR